MKNKRLNELFFRHLLEAEKTAFKQYFTAEEFEPGMDVVIWYIYDDDELWISGVFDQAESDCQGSKYQIDEADIMALMKQYEFENDIDHV